MLCLSDKQSIKSVMVVITLTSLLQMRTESDVKQTSVNWYPRCLFWFAWRTRRVGFTAAGQFRYSQLCYLGHKLICQCLNVMVLIKSFCECHFHFFKSYLCSPSFRLIYSQNFSVLSSDCHDPDERNSESIKMLIHSSESPSIITVC